MKNQKINLIKEVQILFWSFIKLGIKKQTSIFNLYTKGRLQFDSGLAEIDEEQKNQLW